MEPPLGTMSYVLVTAAYNEEDRIGETIECVINQTVPPERWLIVSDGSVDRTDDIIKNYSQKFPFISYHRLEKNRNQPRKIDMTSQAQAKAMNIARERFSGIPYDLLGNLDADITFGSRYYESIITKFALDSNLGIAGGGAYNVQRDGRVESMGFIQEDFVGGPIQLFRRQCLDDIGGYSSHGHSDSVAVFSARMKGWNVRCFPEIRAFHHGMPGNSIKEKVPICFRMGQMDFIMGAFFPFMIGRSILRMMSRPFVLSGVAMISGFVWAALKGEKCQLTKDVVEYMRRDQRNKIFHPFRPRR